MAGASGGAASRGRSGAGDGAAAPMAGRCGRSELRGLGGEASGVGWGQGWWSWGAGEKPGKTERRKSKRGGSGAMLGYGIAYSIPEVLNRATIY